MRSISLFALSIVASTILSIILIENIAPFPQHSFNISNNSVSLDGNAHMIAINILLGWPLAFLTLLFMHINRETKFSYYLMVALFLAFITGYSYEIVNALPLSIQTLPNVLAFHSCLAIFCSTTFFIPCLLCYYVASLKFDTK